MVSSVCLRSFTFTVYSNVFAQNCAYKLNFKMYHCNIENWAHDFKSTRFANKTIFFYPVTYKLFTTWEMLSLGLFFNTTDTSVYLYIDVFTYDICAYLY